MSDTEENKDTTVDNHGVIRSIDDLEEGMGDPIANVREFCAKRGANGIKGIARTFKIMDRNANSRIGFKDFKDGLEKFGLTMSDDECKSIFDKFDKDHTAKISFDEFLEALQPPMNERRMAFVKKAFLDLDVSKTGEITIDDLEKFYTVDNDIKNRENGGSCTESECWKAFVQAFFPHSKRQFETENRKIKITEEEFIDYYRGVSADIDSDDYFESMMKTTWGRFRKAKQK